MTIERAELNGLPEAVQRLTAIGRIAQGSVFVEEMLRRLIRMVGGPAGEELALKRQPDSLLKAAKELVDRAELRDDVRQALHTLFDDSDRVLKRRNDYIHGFWGTDPEVLIKSRTWRPSGNAHTSASVHDAWHVGDQLEHLGGRILLIHLQLRPEPPL